MIAVITGDIINSRSVDASVWLSELKAVLQKYGTSPQDWELFRGDSFQLKVPYSVALETLVHIKAAIKQYKSLDVRMAIGIGIQSFKGGRISESNGEAYINSGQLFEDLGKNTAMVRTPWKEFDETINLMLLLAAIKMDDWTPSSSEIIKACIEYPELKQADLAIKLGKSQSDISKGIKRGGFDAVKQMIHYYKTEIEKLC